ncbi:hypothetical protein [Albidovulum sediminis]|uniref:Lipoprotein n=1 Tax=Albidovulum sediminis TaxID=3066345 RepID=A0ABT2NKD4_9RHOB|nr:hypothetical protein [Defluviimonas sediminis]MCT8328543.1 hypothetical protein [Defluviimonas sediminis]
MARGLLPLALVAGLMAGPGACAPAPAPAERGEAAAFAPAYGAIAASMLDTGLQGVRVTMEGARGPADADAYARCASVGYALGNGAKFLRHIRTNIDEEGGIWHADAVYTVSPDLPEGVQVIDAETAAAECADQGIPTV